MAEGEESEKKHGFFGKLLRLAFIGAMIAAIVAFSGAGIGFLLVAVMCTAMMAMMMGGMSHGDGDGGSDRR